jgi:hypothetical protein
MNRKARGAKGDKGGRPFTEWAVILDTHNVERHSYQCVRLTLVWLVRSASLPGAGVVLSAVSSMESAGRPLGFSSPLVLPSFHGALSKTSPL